jgi:hypothetical protein
MYHLYYNKHTPVQHLKDPIWSGIEAYCTSANEILMLGQFSWIKQTLADYQVDMIANFVRLNIFSRQLQAGEELMKPILCDENFAVITGGTRLMALQANPQIISAPVLVQAPFNKQMPGMHHIAHPVQLANITGCEQHKILTGGKDWRKERLTWIEFDLVESSNHYHNVEQRLNMMCNYLQTMPENFQFSPKWLFEPIYWMAFDNV